MMIAAMNWLRALRRARQPVPSAANGRGPLTRPAPATPAPHHYSRPIGYCSGRRTQEEKEEMTSRVERRGVECFLADAMVRA